MDERTGQGQSFEEKIDILRNMRTPSRQKQNEALLGLLKVIMESPVEGENFTIDQIDFALLVGHLAAFFKARGDYCQESITMNDTMLKLLDDVRKERSLTDLERHTFEALRLMGIAERETKTDQLNDNAISYCLAAFMFLLLQNVTELEPIRKRVSIFVPAMQDIYERMKKSQEAETQAKTDDQNWLERYAKPRGREVT